MDPEYKRFLYRNILRGLLYFIGIIGIYFLAREYMPDNWYLLLEPFTSRPAVMYLIFFASETFFGIIPPEFFVIWALKNPLPQYVLMIALFALISYTGGFIAYMVGKKLHGGLIYNRLQNSQFRKYLEYYQKYGGVLIGISALTPFPYATISLISGTFGFPTKKYHLFASLRFLRFIIYGFFFWEVH